MKKVWIAVSLCVLAVSGCSSKNEPTPAAPSTPSIPPAQTQPAANPNDELSKEGHNTLLMFYSFYALKSEEGFNEWLNAVFTKPDQYKEQFKKIFKPGTYTNVAVEFSGFQVKPGAGNEAEVTSNIKLHLINKPQNKEDLFDKKISAKIVKDEKSQSYKIVSFEEK